MTRFHSPRKPGIRVSVITMLTAATCLGTAHAAETEKVIFAAENALYGAGHDIGRADGWFDEQLRTAIRAYQNENGLQTNGNLDAPTLKALGVTKASSATITTNSVGSRKASLAELGLSLPEPTPSTPTVARTEPKPVPKPTPDPVQQSSEKIEPKNEPDAESFQNQIVAEETSTKTEVTAVEEVSVAAQATSRPEVSEPPAPAPTPEPEIVDRTTPEATEEPDPILAQLPTEPTGAGNAEPETIDTKKVQPEQTDTPAPRKPAVADNTRSTGGGFFSALFDFFFGWLV
jgi:peptidoglycan hydrolase-like protein with peptidoglycan-binding domain